MIEFESVTSCVAENEESSGGLRPKSSFDTDRESALPMSKIRDSEASPSGVENRSGTLMCSEILTRWSTDTTTGIVRDSPGARDSGPLGNETETPEVGLGIEGVINRSAAEVLTMTTELARSWTSRFGVYRSRGAPPWKRRNA